jgi:hypothetical protein
VTVQYRGTSRVLLAQVGISKSLLTNCRLGKGLQSFEKNVQKGEDLIPNTRILDSSDIVTKTI